MATMVHQGHGRHTLAYNQERTCASLALVGAEAKKAACEYQNQAAAGAGAFVDHDEIKWRDGVTRNASGGLSVPVVGGNDEDTLMADAGVRDEVAAALHALAQHSACTTHTRIAVSLPALPNPPAGDRIGTPVRAHCVRSGGGHTSVTHHLWSSRDIPGSYAAQRGLRLPHVKPTEASLRVQGASHGRSAICRVTD